MELEEEKTKRDERAGRGEKAYRDYVAGLPSYLAAFAEPQHYERYTSENQAVWRFIMRQLTRLFKLKAPEIYERGLAKASIPVERIPRIEEMIESLNEIGWGAICVNGFIPPAAFMEYNAHRILPISADMRTLKHLLYTPAPDIVHEAAGHAPIVSDPNYARFLQRVGEIGAKALSNRHDLRVYEAIRKLSIVKEHPHSTGEEIDSAQKELDEANGQRARHPASEAQAISRFHWWTVEYGLLKHPQRGMLMYGAGLLSSLGESVNCLEDRVTKIKLDSDCVKTDYDITDEQPQLFYVESFEELFPVLEALADTMAFRVGGALSLEKAMECGCTATAVYDSGIQVSGVWTKCLKGVGGEALYIGTSGPTSLSFGNVELEGHGEGYHAHGFSSPVGRPLGADTPLSQMGDGELAGLGLVIGKRARLSFDGGVTVEGLLRRIVTKEGRHLLMSFEDCRVRGSKDEVLFEPEWGTYDMALGEHLVSVFGGPADKKNYDFIAKKSSMRSPLIAYTEEESGVFDFYGRLRKMRESGGVRKGSEKELEELYESVRTKARGNWLLPLEVMELIQKGPDSASLKKLKERVERDLEELKGQDSETKSLIEMGLDLAHL
ncbi:MAG: aromatic amino acid hydroxylase [Bacteriovoracales bacterium]|nr:aromatic amino acid hydroxylase [Bacteriovoracales bacterium]